MFQYIYIYIYIYISASGHPANKPNVDSMPVHGPRRRSGTKSAHCQCQYVVSIEQQLTYHGAAQQESERPHTYKASRVIMTSLVQCWSTVYDGILGSNIRWLWLDAGQSLFRR